MRNKITFLPSSAIDRVLQQAYSAMDVFLHLSRIGESFGLVLVEAAQAGLPIATLATPLKDDAQGEVVRRMQAGGEAWTVHDLALLAIQLAEQARADPSIRQSISSQANRSFGATSLIEGFEDFFNSVIRLRPKELAGRAFCLPCEQGSFANRVDSAASMRLKRQGEVLCHSGFLYWLAFRILYSPRIYRLYRMCQESRYLKRQLVRAAEIRTILEVPLTGNR